VAWVNHEPVTTGEFRQQILLKRGDVIAYFRTTYGARYDRYFWSTAYGGEIPSEVVKERAMEEIKKIKIQLLLAKKEGLIEHIDYQSLMKEMEEENKRRRRAIAKNQVVYGQEAFDEQTFMCHLLAVLRNTLKERLSDKWTITDREIRNYYEAIKDFYYVQNTRMKARETSLSYVSGDGDIDAEMKADCHHTMLELEKKLKKGECLDTAAGELKKNRRFSISLFDFETAQPDTAINPELRSILPELTPGMAGTAIDTGESFSLVQCLEKENITYEAYEKIKDNLKTRYLEFAYDEYINDLANNAGLRIADDVYEQMAVDR
jgi:hypothetical protein